MTHLNEARTLSGIVRTARQPGLMKVCFNVTIFCFYLVCYLYAETDFDVHANGVYIVF